MIEPKPSFLRNILVRALICGVAVLAIRFAYVVTVAGGSCDLGDFCFFSLPENLNLNLVIAGTATSATEAAPIAPPTRDVRKGKDWIRAVKFYSSVFEDLISEEFLSPSFKSLCVESVSGDDVHALKEIGVKNSVGVAGKSSRALAKYRDGTFDFVFCGGGRFDWVPQPANLAAEMQRTLKPKGFIVVHVRANDTYSFNSFLQLFDDCRLLRMLDINGFDPAMAQIREIILKKESDFHVRNNLGSKPSSKSGNKCEVPAYKQRIVAGAEPLIEEEPLKPWLTLKRNLADIKYLPSIVDISFKSKYVYVDIGARSYGSSIGSWFRKQYPKQNKTFEVYAIEADKHFHNDYKRKKGVTLLPYAAWVRNESLFFEINRDTDQKVQEKGRGMGRIQPGQSSARPNNGDVEKITAFDFAEWLKRTVSEKDFVVVKMDVEGTEFELIPRLFKTGAICLIDEIFLECHYNRWQRCCPGVRSSKYEKTYGQCLELFTSLRQSGVLVHQWW
ncbi:hypothetical protein CDL15_Pgr000532 [Punica granatum]|uniref:Methyltransferase FkbM domain-containing protein n=1 Tax=Punica granatum TaxID=22663 RepID=A0A218W445_PUNGR|nr:hypothetical protein CDL15_Pgr000532 [Punica granatum]